MGSAEGLDFVSAKDLAGQLTDHDWNLFNSIHQVQGAELRGGQAAGHPAWDPLISHSVPQTR